MKSLPWKTTRHLLSLGVIPLCLFAACDSSTIGSTATTEVPSVTVRRIDDGSHPGYLKSGQSFSGIVSWYSVKTNGGTTTASGERLSDSGDTAAHKTLPFGTMVKVTNLSNERSVILRINDRGPFTKGRVLDVSIGAAKKLDFAGRGITRCHVEVLRPVEED
jgi:rare lipoprotein A (peptidoglycan hydrolase)